MKSHFSSRRVLGVSALLVLGAASAKAPAQAQPTEATPPQPTTPAQPSDTAQPSELDALRQQISELQKRLDSLEESQKKSAATAKTAPPATSKSPITVSGLFQVHSLDYLNEKTNPGGSASNDTFRLRRAEVRVTAPSITQRLAATVMFDLARPSGTNAIGTFQGSANNILQDLQLTYKLSPIPNTKSQVFVDAGQFKVPIGYESALVSTGNLPFLERSLIYSGRDRFGTTYGDQRDTGAQLRLVSPQVEARVGAFNGFGDRQNSLAASDAKAIVALLAYKPKKFAGLTLGASGGIGNTGVTFTSTDTPPTTTNLRAHRHLANAFLNYKIGKFTAQGEYLRGDASSFLAGTVTNEAVNPQGYYFGGSYLFSPHFEVLARFDSLDFNHKIDNATVRDYLLGLNYYISGQNKVQVNLVKRVGGEAAPTSSVNPAANYRNDRLELRTGVQLAF